MGGLGLSYEWLSGYWVGTRFRPLLCRTGWRWLKQSIVQFPRVRGVLKIHSGLGDLLEELGFVPYWRKCFGSRCLSAGGVAF